MDATTIDATTFTLSGGITGTVTYDPGTRAATFTPAQNLAFGTTYTATITARAKDLAGKSMESDYTWSFTTCSLPSVPFAPTPSNGSKGISTDATLTWSSDNGTSYDVYFGTTSLPPLITTVATPTYDLPPLSYGTTYYWKIVAKNGCGNTTAGAVWSFVTRSIEITPGEGTIGTVVTIRGDNLGVKNGAVLIENVVLKSMSWGSSEIQASLSKAISPGTYSVTVKPKTKGVLPITEANLFTVRGPEIDSGSPSAGAPGETITLSGKFFGNKKGNVYLEYESKGVTKLKSCKVWSWDMDPKFGDGEVVFVVPKGLAPGTYPLKITNKVGEDIGEFTIVP
jgi:hypothetical protein